MAQRFTPDILFLLGPPLDPGLLPNLDEARRLPSLPVEAEATL
jgi:hypothetical protein